MRLKLLLFIVAVFAVYGIDWEAPVSCAVDNGNCVFVFLPSIDTSFDNLDARDTQNRPVKNSSATTNLQKLFQESIYSLLVNSELYSIAFAMSVLKESLKLAESFLFRALPYFGEFIAAFISSTRKFADTLLRLSGLLAILITCFTFIASSDVCITHRRIAYLILRC